MYNRDLIDIDQKVNLDVTDQTINALLDELFVNTNIDYKIINRQIILSGEESSNYSKQQQRTIGGKVTDKDGIAVITSYSIHYTKLYE